MDKDYYQEGYKSGYWDYKLGLRLNVCLYSHLKNYAAGYKDGQNAAMEANNV